MCHQSVGLIQSILENAGVATVSVSVLREVTARVVPSRALFPDFPLGYPQGAPGDAVLQRHVILSALALLTDAAPLPLLRVFEDH